MGLSQMKEQILLFSGTHVQITNWRLSGTLLQLLQTFLFSKKQSLPQVNSNVSTATITFRFIYLFIGEKLWKAYRNLNISATKYSHYNWDLLEFKKSCGHSTSLSRVGGAGLHFNWLTSHIDHQKAKGIPVWMFAKNIGWQSICLVPSLMILRFGTWQNYLEDLGMGGRWRIWIPGFLAMLHSRAVDITVLSAWLLWVVSMFHPYSHSVILIHVATMS